MKAKDTFNATRIERAKGYMFFILIIFLFNSCKKELLISHYPPDQHKTVGGVNIKTISYKQFLSTIDLKEIGNLQQVLAGKPNKITNSGTDVLSEVTRNTDSVTRLQINDTVSYVLRISNNESKSAMFSNLTIQRISGVTKAFVTTYKPTKNWIESYKRNRNIVFNGVIKHTPLALQDQGYSKNSKNQVLSWTCTNFNVYNIVARSCTGTGDQRHWPGETCQNDGGPGAPSWEVVVTIGMECGGGGNGGSGEGGGANYPPNSGGNTTPTPPENYEPCSAFSETGEEFLIPCTGDGNTGQPLTPAQQLIIQLEIADTQQMNLLNSDAFLVLQLQSYLNVNGNSIDSKNFASWAVAFLTVNPAENIQSFVENFLSISEGGDAEVGDLGYYSNSVSQQQQLPPLQTYYTNYPKNVSSGVIKGLTASETYTLVGGTINTKNKNNNPDYQNACALRGSRALNYAGLEIPELVYDNRKKTEKGADGKNYILSATAFNRYMRETFGPPTYI